MKFLWLLALLVCASRLFLGRWPWQLALFKTRSDAADKARTLLGLSKKAGREEIIEAHRKLVSMVHPDRGGTSELVHEANAARDLLLEEAARQISESS